MPLLLPLSPNVTAQVGSTLDLQRALFQVSTYSDIAAVQGPLQGVANAIQPHREELEHSISSKGVTRRREMRYLDHLIAGDPAGSRLALSEIAMHPKALNLLFRKSPQVARSVAEAATNVKIDATAIRDEHLEWVNGPSTQRHLDLQTGFGKFAYWLGNVTAPKNWLSWGSAILIAAESVGWAGTGEAPSISLPISAFLLSLALYGGLSRGAAKERLVNAAEEGALGFGGAQQFFESFNHFLPNMAPPFAPSANDDVIESIRRSTAPGGTPQLSRAATLRVIADFLNLGSATVEGLRRDASPQTYSRLAQVIGLGTLSRTHWQHSVLNAHRLAVIAEYRRRGKKIIFVRNHRSHKDILEAVAQFPDFGIRFVAKSELLNVPVLGNILRLADHFTVDRDHDEERLEKVTAWGTRMFEKGLSPFFFIEGTRMDTPNRREEVGMRPPEIGAAHLAARFPRDMIIVPVVSYGFGCMLPKDEMQALREGTMLYQPTVTSILEPIDGSEILDDDPALSKDEEIRLNSLLWNRMWEELSRIQAYMNDLSAKAA
jgi:1-acyl-sn-glycerol-3-phosphate acyltransferase